MVCLCLDACAVLLDSTEFELFDSDSELLESDFLFLSFISEFHSRFSSKAVETMASKDRGYAVLREPQTNLDGAFDDKQRRDLGLVGLLPPRHQSMSVQATRALRFLSTLKTPLDKYMFLMALQVSLPPSWNKPAMLINTVHGLRAKICFFFLESPCECRIEMRRSSTTSSSRTLST